MLLALKPSMQSDIIKPPLDYQPYKASHSRYSPPESPRNIPSLFDSERMNNPHRGLPIPAGLNLPPPDRGPSTAPATLGHLPAPPSQWSGQDESMRSWLHAKAEEDRRKQEEERTRQEGLRLDQRRIEERMLRDSLAGGIPPPMVPLIFAGIGGGNLPGHTLEWAQQYLASLSIQNQQQQQQIQVQQQQLQQQQPPSQPQPQPQTQLPPSQASPDLRRDHRMIPPNPYGASAPSQNAPVPSAAPPSRPPLGSILSSAAPSTSLSRLNTTDFVPSAGAPRQSLHPLQQSQPAPGEQGPGHALFFHHWTPPSGNNQAPPTPSGKSNQGSPFGQAAASHLRADYQNSPKKRKAAGGHPQQPPPTSAPGGDGPSPPYSGPPSREGEGDREHSQSRHVRHHSQSSSQEDHQARNIARPSSRQQRADELSTGASGPRRQFTGGSSSGSSEERYEGMKAETR